MWPLLVGAPAAYAQVQGPTLEGGQHFAFSASGFWADVNSGARADGTGGRIGTRLDFESDLGLDATSTRWIATASYGFNRRHSLELSYFNLNRDAERALTDPISFRDHEFVPEPALKTQVDSEIWRLSYSYAFVDTPRHRATVQAGVHVPRISINLSGRRIDDSASVSANMPLPVVGLGYAYRISSRWIAEARGQVFRIKVDNVDGSLDNLSALIAYSPARSTSIFVGYNYYRLNATLTKRAWTGEANIDYYGPWAGIVVGFGGER